MYEKYNKNIGYKGYKVTMYEKYNKNIGYKGYKVTKLI